MTIKLGELVADKYSLTVDISHITRLEVTILHAIKSIAVVQWARESLAIMKQGKRG